MGALSDITCATMELADEIMDSLYIVHDDKPVLYYDDFYSLNLNNKYYDFQEDGLLIKTASDPIKISSHEFEYIMDCYINKGFNAPAEMGRRSYPENYEESTVFKTLSGYAEHSLVHIFETMKQAHLSCQRIQRDDLMFMKNDIEKLSIQTCLLHDLGMSNGLQFRDVNGEKLAQGFEITDKGYRSAHSALSGYTILSDMQSMFKNEKGEINERDMYICVLAAAAHSKSNSGLVNLNKETQEAFLLKFKERCDDWDAKRGISGTFDINTARKYLNENQDLFREVSRVVSLSDACAHSRYTADTIYSQTEGTFEIYKTSTSTRGEDHNSFNEKIAVLTQSEPLAYLQSLNPNLEISEHKEGEAFYVIQTDHDGEKQLIDANPFVIGERFCSFQEQYYNNSGSLFELRIGNINPSVKEAAAGVSKYIEERIGEVWRYYSDNNIKLTIDIRCNETAKDSCGILDESKWYGIVTDTVYKLDYGEKGDPRNWNIEFKVNGNEVKHQRPAA